MTWALTPAEQPADNDGEPFRPTRLMEKASRYVEKAGEVESRRALERAVTGNAVAIRQAIEILVAGGYFAETAGARNAKRLTSVKPYREADDA